MTGILALSVLAGCGSSGNVSAAGASDEGAPGAQDTTPGNKITVAASATPHAEILEQAKPLLKEKGYDLEVTIFDDYVQPNNVVESGEFDANYFQHIPYLMIPSTRSRVHIL